MDQTRFNELRSEAEAAITALMRVSIEGRNHGFGFWNAVDYRQSCEGDKTTYEQCGLKVAFYCPIALSERAEPPKVSFPTIERFEDLGAENREAFLRQVISPMGSDEAIEFLIDSLVRIYPARQRSPGSSPD